MIGKRKRLRSAALLDAPRGLNCVIPGCNGPAVGVCHLPHGLWGFSTSASSKTHDWLGAHLCHEHHGYADGADGRNDHAWRAMVLALTLQRLLDMGVLIIQGEDHRLDTYDDQPF